VANVPVPSVGVMLSALRCNLNKHIQMGQADTWQRARSAGVPTPRPCTGLTDL
jgi:hypothetical protein